MKSMKKEDEKRSVSSRPADRSVRAYKAWILGQAKDLTKDQRIHKELGYVTQLFFALLDANDNLTRFPLFRLVVERCLGFFIITLPGHHLFH
jgi:hypothetical protein